MDEKEVEKDIRKLLKSIGEDPDRVGLKDTPKRVAKMFKQVFKGYNETKLPKITVFPNGQDGVEVEGMVNDEGYFFSYCEHHMVPFFGYYYFAYIPDKKVIGLSKIARVIDYFAAKLQIQERLAKDVIDFLDKELESQGIAITLVARHLCKEMRGVKKFNAKMTYTALRGAFKEDDKARNEYVTWVHSK